MAATDSSELTENKPVSRWAFPAVIFLLFIIWFFFPKRAGVFPLDDAYIHLSYVRNLVDTGTFSLNPGEPSMGTSSPLWVVILAPFYLLGADLYWTAQIICFFLFGFLCFLAMDTVKSSAIKLQFSQNEATICSFMSGLLLILNGNLHWFAWSGMETMMFLCLCFLAIKIYSRRGFDHVTGIICGLVFLTRAPGALLVAVFILFDLGRKRFSTLYRGLIVFLLVISPYLFLSMKITGGLLPTTVRGKLVTYVDGGLDWGRIAKSNFRDKFLIQQLSRAKIIKDDPSSPYFFYFNDDIKDEEQLRQRLRQITSINIEMVAAWWRMSKMNRIFWFLKALFIYQKFLPHNIIMLAVMSIIVLFVAYKRRWQDILATAINEQLECTVLAVWGVVHLSLYTIKFRILLHHARYLANEFIIGTILGSLGILIIYRHRPKREAKFLGAISIVLAFSTLFYWQDVYANNVKHIDEVYIKMGKWINQNTPPDARVAAFDIGVLRYIGNRYTVDLGGLADPEVHPYLEKRECGEYIYKKGADFILYSRNLEVDFFTGIFLAEYQGPMLLKQAPVVHFETPQFEAPVLIHSYRLDLNKITGWFPPTPEGVLDAFSYDGRPYIPIGKMIDDSLELVGYTIDQRSIEYIPFYPYAINFTFIYRALKPLKRAYWFHTGFFQTERDTSTPVWMNIERFKFRFSHIPTNNLLPYERWPVNKLIQDHHSYFIPINFHKLIYRVRIATSGSEMEDDPKKLTWTDLGEFENKGNILKPIDHQQMMAISAN